MIALDLWHPPSRPVSAVCAEEADVAWAALGSAHHPHTHGDLDAGLRGLTCRPTDNREPQGR